MPSPQGTTLLATSGCGTDTSWICFGCCTGGDQPVFHKSSFSPVTLVTCGLPTADTVVGSFARGPTVNRVVVWRVSKIAEAETRERQAVAVSKSRTTLLPAAHVTRTSARDVLRRRRQRASESCGRFKLQKTSSALRHGKVSSLLPSILHNTDSRRRDFPNLHTARASVHERKPVANGSNKKAAANTLDIAKETR